MTCTDASARWAAARTRATSRGTASALMRSTTWAGRYRKMFASDSSPVRSRGVPNSADQAAASSTAAVVSQARSSAGRACSPWDRAPRKASTSPDPVVTPISTGLVTASDQEPMSMT
jgi:hypothetical protein